ncbi:hypothetical protein D9757_006096 [Collybiopsis confluens]|uniref:Rpr2-domain-containing protein n=1 Tax=Collybiopsis confluens TaxID=2823264 RepID=A0A8H5HHV6_9AGAR|nr:hypothetical protein D9757_006096 [Collybiopsis confluens]
MGKKQKNEIPNPSSVSNRDVIQRLNFLYQASVYLNTVHCSTSQLPPSSSSSLSSAPDDPTTNQKKKGKEKKKTVGLGDLSRSYIGTMKSVGTKTTVQLDPSVKRTLCKRCNTVLIPGSTASVRTKKSPSHGHFMVYTCGVCKHSVRIPAAPIVVPLIQTDYDNGDAPVPSKPASSNVGGGGLPRKEIAERSTDAAMDLEQAQAHQDSATTSSRRQKHQTNDTPDPKTREEQSRRQNQRKKKKTLALRVPPLFARDAGHVVFKGNERLESSKGSWDDGIFIT